jgi:uncharacterized protein YeaO (DUF488 family)
MKLKTQRIYDLADTGVALRVLVDRLWPRGLSKAEARVDLWAKDLAPSNELRRWFAHEEEKWPQFKARYFAELDARAEAVDHLLAQLKSHGAVLLYAAKEPRYNNAQALKEYLQGRAGHR